MQRIEHSFVAMGGPCRLRLDCEETAAARTAASAAINAGEAQVRRLESKYSRYLPDSLTSEINRCAGASSPVAIDTETAGLLNYASTLWRESDGMFDLTSGVLRRAWNFKTASLPCQSELDELLPLIGWDTVEWDETSVRLPRRGMELDFGGCVKEYACDSALAVLRQHGVQHALVDLSGDMAALGGQCKSSERAGENTERVTPWQIGIRHPGERDEAIAHIPLLEGGLASSGDYERYMEVGGQRYGHILNPKTGWPVQGLAAVSVASEQCLVAGSTATLALLMPQKEALAWLENLGLSWLAVDTQFNIHGTVC